MAKSPTAVAAPVDRTGASALSFSIVKLSSIPFQEAIHQIKCSTFAV